MPTPPTAEDVFAEFLERREAGEAVAFESVCAAHPALAETLRRVHARWQAMTSAFAALAPDTAGSERIRALLDRLAAGRDRNARYALGSELARGAMGRVLRAHDQELGRDVAIKVSRAEPWDLRQHRRFLEEAQITGQLDHPGIVPIHELGVDAEGRPYFAMRLVQGRDLGRIFALVHQGGEGWTRTRALHVLLRVCEAMAYAHSKGVVHRDLKPGNVMVGQFGETYVVDWGLARVAGRETGPEPDAPLPVRADLTEADHDSPLLTRDGEVLGTPAYMSPEQARGELDRVDARADIYALGAMLYHLLSGRMPYVGSGETPPSAQVLSRVLSGPPPPIAAGREVPAELCAICERAMARAPEDRYPGMEALAEDLRAFLEVRVVRAYAGGPWAELRKWVQRNRGLAAAITCALLLLVAGLLLSTRLWRSAEQHRSRADAAAGELRQELDRSQFERARLALRLDDAANAETWLWRQMLAGSHPRATHWALWELYSRTPCVAAIPTRERGYEVVAFAARHQSVLVGSGDGLLRQLRDDDLHTTAELGNAGSGIQSIAVHEGGDLVATGGADGALCFWSLDQRRLLRRVAAYTGNVRAMASDRAGFLSGGEDGRVLLWSSPDAAPELVQRHAHPVWSVACSSGGRWIASGDARGGILLRDRHVGKSFPLGGAWSQVMGLSFAPDDSELWTGGADHQLRVWDLATRACVATMPTRNATCRDLLHLDAHSVAAGGWWRIDRWTTATREHAPLLLSGVWAMDYAPGTARLVASDTSGLRLFDLASLQAAPPGSAADTGSASAATARRVVRRDRIERPERGEMMALAGNGQRVAVYCGRRLLVRSLPGGEVVRDFGLQPRYPDRLELDAEGRRLLLARSEPRDRLRVLDVDSGEVVLTTEPPTDAAFQQSYALRPDGRELAVVRGRNVVRRYNLGNGRLIEEWPEEATEVLRVTYSADSSWLAVSARRRSTVTLCSTRDGARREIPVPANPSCIALAPDGRRLLSGGWNGELAMVALPEGRVTARMTIGTGAVWSMAWCVKDPDLLVCAGGAGPLTFCDLASSRACLTLESPWATAAHVLCLSDDGSTLTATSERGAMLVDLTYYDRHIAGNLPFQLGRLRDTVELPPGRAAELERDAEAVRRRPWPRLRPW